LQSEARDLAVIVDPQNGRPRADFIGNLDVHLPANASGTSGSLVLAKCASPFT